MFVVQFEVDIVYSDGSEFCSFNSSQLLNQPCGVRFVCVLFFINFYWMCNRLYQIFPFRENFVACKFVSVMYGNKIFVRLYLHPLIALDSTPDLHSLSRK